MDRYSRRASSLLGVVVLLGIPWGGAVRRPIAGVTFRVSYLVHAVGPTPTDTGEQRVLSAAQVFAGQYAAGRERLDVQGAGGRRIIEPNRYVLVDSLSTRLVDSVHRRVLDTSLAIGALATLDRLAAARVPVTALTVRFDSLPAATPTMVVDTLGPGWVVFDPLDGRLVRRYRVTMQWMMPAAGTLAAMWQQTEYWVANFPINPTNPYSVEHDARVVGLLGPERRTLRADLAVLGTGTVIKISCRIRSTIPGAVPVEQLQSVDLMAVRAATIEDSALAEPDFSGVVKQGSPRRRTRTRPASANPRPRERDPVPDARAQIDDAWSKAFDPRRTGKLHTVEHFASAVHAVIDRATR